MKLLSLSPINTLVESITSYPTALSYGVAVGFSLLMYGYFYYRNLYTFFAKRGLKNPPVLPLLGNFVTVVRADRMKLVREWTKKYGKFYGVFYGLRPKFVVADADVLRQVCIQDFDSMPNHERSHLLNDYQKNFLFFMGDEHWKRVRAMQTPIFTSGKIKRMFKLLDKCADDLVQCFDEQAGKSERPASEGVLVNLKEIYSLYTLDCIASAAYSLKLNREGTSSIKAAASRDEFVGHANRLMHVNSLRLAVVLSVPQRLARWLGLTMVPNSINEGLAERVRQVIEGRKRSGKKFDDYLQILVDARLDDKIELGAMDDKENHHAGLTNDSLQADQAKMLNDIVLTNGAKPDISQTTNETMQTNTTIKLSEDEIVASAIFLLIVGVETTATLLTCCTYALAFHQDIQDRLLQTIKDLSTMDKTTGELSFDYESLTASPYLDAVICESLRALSPVIELDRMVDRDCYIEKYGVTVKKGEVLLLSYYGIMNNPEYFPEPLKFDPERFMPENRDKIYPGSYCPFGLGPRHCIGMRFSLTEAKVALAKVLMKYKFAPAPGTVYPPSTERTVGLNNLASPVAMLLSR